MNYFKNQEIEQIMEEPDRAPKPASSHLALTQSRRARPRKDRTGLKAGLFALACFVFVLIANMYDLPAILLSLFAGMLIGTFAYMTIKGDKNV